MRTPDRRVGPIERRRGAPRLAPDAPVVTDARLATVRDLWRALQQTKKGTPEHLALVQAIRTHSDAFMDDVAQSWRDHAPGRSGR